MSHEIEEVDGVAAMFYVGNNVPWHNLGTRLDAPPTVEAALSAALADWEAGKVEVWAKMPNGELIRCKDHSAIIRLTDQAVLGVVSKDYSVLQNQKAFGILQPLIDSGLATLETGGVLRDGQVVWLMAKLGEAFEVIPGDEVKPYLLATNGHNGKRGAQTRFTAVNTVCSNTLSLAIGADEMSLKKRAEKDRQDGAMRLRHVGNVSARADALGVYLRRLVETQQALKEVYQTLARTPVTERDVDRICIHLLPDNPEAKDHSRTEEQRSVLMEILDSGPNAKVPGVRGTAYGMLQGALDYADHYKGVPKDTSLRTEAKSTRRLETNWFGETNRFKWQAMELVCELMGEMAPSGAAKIGAVQASLAPDLVEAIAGATLAEVGMV